jgi:hypothetical protein
MTAAVPDRHGRAPARCPAPGLGVAGLVRDVATTCARTVEPVGAAVVVFGDNRAELGCCPARGERRAAARPEL